MKLSGLLGCSCLALFVNSLVYLPPGGGDEDEWVRKLMVPKWFHFISSPPLRVSGAGQAVALT